MASVEVSGSGGRFGRARRWVGLGLGPMVSLALWFALGDLSDPARRLAAVVGLVMVYWITEALPLAATALLGPALAVGLGIASPREALAPFSDPVIFLLLGSFLLSEALRVHGLDRRMALWILTLPWAAASAMRTRLALGLATALVSMCVNNAATAAMMLPVALGLVRALGAAGSRESPRGTLLVVGIAASVGGMATPVGAASNLIALGFMERVAGQPISFLLFMAIGVPLSLALMGVAFLVVAVLLPGRGARQDPAVYVAVARERSVQPDWTAGLTACAVAFGLAAAGWFLVSGARWLPWGSVSAGEHIGLHLDEGVVALLAAALLFAWPLGGDRRALSWENAGRIDWGTLLLFGGSLAMGRLMFETGLASALGRSAMSVTGVHSLWGLTAFALGAALVLSEVASNAGTVGMMAPLVLAAAKELGLPAAPPLLAVCFGASAGFMFPMGAPQSAMVYGTGLVPLTTMMRVGLVVDFLSFFVILGALRLLCPILGLA